MNNDSIAQNKPEINQILQDIKAYAQKGEYKLILHCLKRGDTLTDIAAALGTSRQALSDKYPGIGKTKRSIAK